MLGKMHSKNLTGDAGPRRVFYIYYVRDPGDWSVAIVGTPVLVFILFAGWHTPLSVQRSWFYSCVTLVLMIIATAPFLSRIEKL